MFQSAVVITFGQLISFLPGRVGREFPIRSEDDTYPIADTRLGPPLSVLVFRRGPGDTNRERRPATGTSVSPGDT